MTTTRNRHTAAARFIDKVPAPTKREMERESPPVSETPGWAIPAPPARDEAARTLFPEEHAQADQFWDWLTDTYRETRARLWRGYHYLENPAWGNRDIEAEELYDALCTWCSWLEAAWWLLTAWYSDQKCPRLVLPFAAIAHTGNGRPIRLVREYRGIKGEILMEEALRLWRDYAILTHALPNTGDAPTEAPDAE